MIPSGCACATSSAWTQEVVEVVAALDGPEQGQPGERQRGHGWLADARGQGAGLLRAAAQSDEVSGDEVAEAQPLQRVDHGRDRPGLAGSRQGVGVEALLAVVVAELHRAVAEIPQHVAVVDVLAR